MHRLHHRFYYITKSWRERKITDIEELLFKIGIYYGVKREDILNSRVKAAREARVILVYIGVNI